MGRYNFRPARVHDATSRLLKTPLALTTPSWYETVGDIPPSESLVRTRPVQHVYPTKKKVKGRPSKKFKPQKIVYEEDSLRRTFFADHPWELARPRLVLEDDGKDYQRRHAGSSLNSQQLVNGESVVQRQLQLMNKGGNRGSDAARAVAYDQARREFYQYRLNEEVENQVAREEAMATGAYFGKTAIQVGGELESQQYEEWRNWAKQTYLELSTRGSELPAPSAGAGSRTIDVAATDDTILDTTLEPTNQDTPAA